MQVEIPQELAAAQAELAKATADWRAATKAQEDAFERFRQATIRSDLAWHAFQADLQRKLVELAPPAEEG